MKIGDIYSAPHRQVQAGGMSSADGPGTAKKPSQAAERKPEQDRSDLSSLASRASRLSEGHDSARAARIAALRSDFLAGTYKPDVTKLSKALVQSAVEGVNP